MLPAGVLLAFLALGHSMPHEMLTLALDGTFRDPPAITFSRIDTSDCASVVQDCDDCKDAYHAFRIPDRRQYGGPVRTSTSSRPLFLPKERRQ